MQLMDMHLSVFSNGLKFFFGGWDFKYDVHILIQVKAFSSPSPIFLHICKNGANVVWRMHGNGRWVIK